MPEPKFEFMSFRSTEEPVEYSDMSSPANVLAAALEHEHTSYEMVVSKLDRDEASIDPEFGDLFPNGPESGPESVFLYHFITTEKYFSTAQSIAIRLYPSNEID